MSQEESSMSKREAGSVKLLLLTQERGKTLLVSILVEKQLFFFLQETGEDGDIMLIRQKTDSFNSYSEISALCCQSIFKSS